MVPGRTHVDPGVLVDRLFAAVLDLLNELMERTPVEQLQHVSISPADDLPATAGNLDPFAPSIRQSIRMQLGF